MPTHNLPADARPFLPLTPGPQNKLRQPVRGGGPKPRESAAEHGEELLRQIEAFQRQVEAQAAARDPNLPPLPDDLQVIVEAPRLMPEQTGSLGLTLLEDREEGLLVTLSPDVTLGTMVSKAQSYVTERTDSGNPRYRGVMAPIDQIRPSGRADKIGDRLAAWLDTAAPDPDGPLWVEIELAGGETDLGVENRREFETYLGQFSADPYAEATVTASGYFLIEADYSLHRLFLPLRAVLDLLDDSRANWILSIDLLPHLEDAPFFVPATARGVFPTLPALSADAPRLVIIDSGLAADHPLFRDAAGRSIVGRQLSFVPASVEPADNTGDDIEGGHGTAVASVAAYGAVSPFSLRPETAPRPLFWLENAKIMVPASKLDPAASPRRPQLHPAQFPTDLMRQVVAAFHQPLPDQCKIFVLAAGGPPHPRSTLSSWAEALDNLSAQHDLLFVVSAGNLSPAELVERLAAESYPDYLLDPQGRLRSPGQAQSALTVGALTPEPLAPMPAWRSDQPLTEPDQPAPFTRSGLPPRRLVKPEVVEIGGNLSRRSGEISAASETALMVANRDFTTGQAPEPLTFQSSAGLAAAKVAHLAGLIQARYPQASANLIRALIVNAAEWPAPFVERLTTPLAQSEPARELRETLLRLCGYGVPQADKALSANARCLVFVAEDAFHWTAEEKTSSGRFPSKVSFFSVRLNPDDLFGLPPATQIRVSVTLAYNPAVRKTQRRRYQAVNMRWDLRRRDQSQEEFKARWMAEAELEEEAEEETGPARRQPWPWQLKPVLNPGGRVRRGAVIRDWFDLFAHDLPPTLELVTLAMVAPWRKPPRPLTQPYALVVSIESLAPEVAIYDAVRVQPPDSF